MNIDSNIPDGTLTIDFLNVGFGDCAYIEFKGKQGPFNMLVDGGRPDTAHYENNSQRIRVSEYLKRRNISRINLLVLTHFHQDHVGGLKEVVENVEIDAFWCNNLMPVKYKGIILNEPDSCPPGPKRLLDAMNIYNYVYFTLSDNNTRICCISKDYKYETGIDNLTIDVLWPDIDRCRELAAHAEDIYDWNNTQFLVEKLDKLDKCLNDFCAVLKIKYKNSSLLLAGDGDDTFWSKFDSDRDLSSTILKLPHHGQIGSFSEKLFKLTNPVYVIISAANDWTFGCPQRTTIEQILEFALKSGVECRPLFTDAVDMIPYSTKDDIHNLIRFLVKSNGVLDVSKLMIL